MKTKKLGISLIVLVITIIVLAILATTVIVSLSNTNIIGEAQDAVNKNNLQAYQDQASLAYASWKIDNKNATLTNVNQLEGYGFDDSTLPTGFKATISNGAPKVVTVDVWDGTYPDATNFILKGTGTEADPYIISSAKELAFLSAYVDAGNEMTGKYIELTTNIDLANQEWDPIGSNHEDLGVPYFCGYFNGNNHTIFNINVSNDGNYCGLFATCFGGGVRDLELNGGTVIGNAETCNVGSVVGSAGYGATCSGLINRNVQVISSWNAGGLIGGGGNLEIDNCINYGNVQGKKFSAGIVAGESSELSVSNCDNYGKIESENSPTGIAFSGANVTNCNNYGEVIVTND